MSSGTANRRLAEMAGPGERAKARILANIDELGLGENVMELEVRGYTVLRGVLSEDRVERAKAAIMRRAERTAGRRIDSEKASAADFNGMEYLHYLIFDDPVFPEILLEPKPLALVTYLLGESCLLSSMGCHFRGPGGMPLAAHVDGQADDFLVAAASIANCNYALTPYTKDAGALVMFPGSHHKQRQPTAHENWTAGGETIADIMRKQLSPEEIDKLDWQLPRGAVTMEIDPGDAVIWHGNSWHAGWRRELPGVRMNLAAYFCRQFMSTQERRGDDRYPEVFERYANEPRFARLLGAEVFNGWREEGPDFSGKKRAPQGRWD